MDIILKFLLFISFSSFSPLAGSQNSKCDKYTQCFLDEASLTQANVECTEVTRGGNTAPPCYGLQSTLECECVDKRYIRSNTNDSFECSRRPTTGHISWGEELDQLKCEAKSCQLNLSDVVIKSNPPIDDGISYQNGTKIICSCPQGSTLKGDDSFVCLYGNWTYDEEPSCEPNTATSFFQSGNILLYLALQTILARMISSNVLN
ncbi:uncharacterized protein [Apostichopus japonicus]|uniref:uncharacterized protein isoform X1 n=1 Tax=Stichopus japonicus TaxID=307972 RepID=UPI003AB604F0